MAAQVNTHWRQVLYAEIGQRVQKIRNDRKLSVRTVATKLGVTYSAVSKVEEGAGAPTHFLVGFAQLTGCTMAHLIPILPMEFGHEIEASDG